MIDTPRDPLERRAAERDRIRQRAYRARIIDRATARSYAAAHGPASVVAAAYIEGTAR